MDKVAAALGKALIERDSNSLLLKGVSIIGDFKVIKSSLAAAVKRYNNAQSLESAGRELTITIMKAQGVLGYEVRAEYSDLLDEMLEEALESAIYGSHGALGEVVLSDKELELAREQLMSAFYVLDASPTEIVASHYVYDVGVLLEENTRQDSLETLLVTFEMEARAHYLSMNRKPLDDIMPILVTYKDGKRLVKFTPPDEVDNYVKAENVSAVVGADKRPEGSDGTVTAA